jgi:hypothetical protein
LRGLRPLPIARDTFEADQPRAIHQIASLGGERLGTSIAFEIVINIIITIMTLSLHNSMTPFNS